MAGMFELFVDEDTCFRFRLTAPDGTVMAVSKAFEDKRAAVAGITAVREYAGMGLITDLCPASIPLNPPAAELPQFVPPACPDRRIPAGVHRSRTGTVRRAAHGAASVSVA